jgi:hypothetical protein
MPGGKTPKAPGPRSGENARSGPTVPEHKRERQKKTLRLLPAESAAPPAGPARPRTGRWGLTESEFCSRRPRRHRGMGFSSTRDRPDAEAHPPTRRVCA